MSRCFPFPPPGYEKEARTDDVELLAKEKHKEKKHKKEKKEKENREGKEIKDKENSKDKHREKKERKETHKSKKKDREREREKSSKSDDRKVEGRSEGSNEEKPSESSLQFDDHIEIKFTEELGKQICDETRQVGNQVCGDYAAPVQRRMESMFSTPVQRRTESLGTAVEKDGEKRTEWKERNESDDRITERQRDKVEGRIDKNEMGQNITVTDQRIRRMGDQKRVEGDYTAPVQRRVESMFSTPVQRRPESLGMAVEKDCEKKKEGDRITERHKDKAEGRITKIETGQDITGTDQSIRRMGDQKRVKGEDKNKEKKNKEGDDGRRDKHRDKDQEEKKSKRKDKEKKKEKDKEKDKVKEKGEDRHKEQDKFRGSKKEQLVTLNIKPRFPLKDSKDSEKSTGSEKNLKKRKDYETNGFIHENDLRPNKLTRLASSSSQMTLENGRKLEPSHITIRCTSDRQGETNSRKEEINKEHKVNGIVEAQQSVVISRPQVPMEPHVNGEASTKLPHPDSICLSQLLCIPKMVELSDSDDQEWLFSSDSLHSKSKASSGVTETPQVWSEALRIESADVYALPYVIPY